jgi:hypothetical protein
LSGLQKLIELASAFTVDFYFGKHWKINVVF